MCNGSDHLNWSLTIWCRLLSYPRYKKFSFLWSHVGKNLDSRVNCPVGWRYRIHRLLFCNGVRLLPPNGCPWYDTKRSDGEVPVMLELWGVQSTSSLPSLPGPLWPGVAASDRVLSMGWIELNCIYTKLNCLK